MAERLRRVTSARLFLALWPDDESRGTLAMWRDRWTWPPGAAVVADERLHLTLHFIGAVAVQRVATLAGALAMPFTPFTFDGGRAERWRGGIAAWSPREVPPELVALHERLAQALRRQALPVEQRPLRPHVTLARRAEHAAAPAEAPAALVWAVRGYALVQSQDGYRVLRRYS